METIDVLIAARAEIEEGWCQWQQERITGEVCAMGALRRVQPEHAHTHAAKPAWQAAVALTRVLPPEARGVVADFNDNSSTTKVDVLALFDRAINAEAQKLAPVSDSAHTFTTAA